MISCLSWWEAHRGRLINEAVNRPVMTVETSGRVSPTQQGSNEIVMKLFVTGEIKNLGNTSAIINKVDQQVWHTGECTVGDNRGKELKGLVGKEVPPNLSLETIHGFSIRPECKGRRIGLVSQGSVHYTDTVTGIPYVQDFSKYLIVPDPTPTPSPTP